MMTNKLIWRGRTLTRKAEIGVSLALESFATNVWAEARRIVPVDTGSLRNSIRIEKYEKKNYTTYRIVAGMEKGGSFGNSGMRSSIGRSSSGVGVGISKAKKGKSWRRPFYALYVELGTSKMAAQPFMRPAFNKFRYRFKRTIRKYMVQTIR